MPMTNSVFSGRYLSNAETGPDKASDDHGSRDRTQQPDVERDHGEATFWSDPWCGAGFGTDGP